MRYLNSFGTTNLSSFSKISEWLRSTVADTTGNKMPYECNIKNEISPIKHLGD